MKTLTHTIIVLAALSMLAAAFAQAQTRQSVVPVAPPSPVPAVEEAIPEPISSQAPSIPPTQVEPVSVEGVDNRAYALFETLSSGTRSGNTGTVLVIPSEQTTTEDLIAINEDMNVMSRIFEKNLEQTRISTAHGNIFSFRQDSFSMILGGGRGGIQSIYLQGFGALFLMNVDFPLSSPPDMQDDEKETQKSEEGDPVWRQMRQQMYEPVNVRGRYRADRPEERYDAEKVENFKTTLINALKHASNIRSVKPDESVILTVTGSGDATGRAITAARLSGVNQIIVQERDADGKMIIRKIQDTSLDDIGLSSPSILVIRTKKSDIDEFAKGDLDFEKFRQRVQLLTYPLLGGADGRGDPFNSYIQRSTGSRNMRR